MEIAEAEREAKAILLLGIFGQPKTVEVEVEFARSRRRRRRREFGFSGFYMKPVRHARTLHFSGKKRALNDGLETRAACWRSAPRPEEVH